MPDVLNGSVNIHYQVVGSGPPLVMLAGWQETSDESLRPLVDYLAQNFSCICIDNRGVGQSSRPTKVFSGWSLAAMANDVQSVLDDLDLGDQRVHILGNSLGGMVAGEFAHRQQSRDGVASLVLLEAGPGWAMIPPPGFSVWTWVAIAKALAQR